MNLLIKVKLHPRERKRIKKKKTGHKIASDCVRIIAANKYKTLDSKANLVKNKNDDLVIEYNPYSMI